MVGILIGCALLFVYYMFIVYCLKQTDFFVEWKKVSAREWLKFMCVQFLGLIFILKFTSANNVIYSWDSFIVWAPAINYSTQLVMQPLVAMHDMYQSINNADYNGFVGMLMAIPLYLLGKSFDMYVVVAWCMFFMTAASILPVSFNLFLSKTDGGKLPVSMMTSILIIIPAISAPMFFGYVYISALLPAVTMWTVFLHTRWDCYDLKRMILLGVLSILVVIQNRTLAYLVVGFWGAVVCYIGILVFKGDNKLDIIKNSIYNMSSMILFNLTVLNVFFRGFFERSVYNNFKEAYSAYAGGLPYLDRLLCTFDYHGIIIWGLVVIGACAGVKKNSLRTHTFFLLVWLLIPIFMINYILIMNNHQMYCIIVAMYYLILLLFYYIENCRTGQKWKIATRVLLALLVCNFMYAYSGTSKTIAHFGLVHTPLVRDDVNEIHAIISDLKKELKNNEKCYIALSNGTFNDDVFRKSSVPYELDAIKNLQGASHVDLRDGFNTAFFDSDVIIIADPAQVHMGEEYQRVITVLNNDLLADNILSKKYRVIKEWNLPNNGQMITVKMLRKIENLNKSDVDFVENQFDDLYPNHPSLFHDRFEAYKEKMVN